MHTVNYIFLCQFWYYIFQILTYFYVYGHGCFTFIYMCVHVETPGAYWGQKWVSDLWSWSHKWSWASMLVLGVEPSAPASERLSSVTGRVRNTYLKGPPGCFHSVCWVGCRGDFCCSQQTCSGLCGSLLGSVPSEFSFWSVCLGSTVFPSAWHRTVSSLYFAFHLPPVVGNTSVTVN